VSDPHPARTPHEKQDKRTFLQKVAEFIHPGPDSTAGLIETLADAEDNDVIGPESRVMLEGVLRMAGLTAGDVMVATPRMDMVDIDAPTTRSSTSSSTPRTRASRCTRTTARTSPAS
jgi:magnesium and cobalt transporter